VPRDVGAIPTASTLRPGSLVSERLANEDEGGAGGPVRRRLPWTPAVL